MILNGLGFSDRPLTLTPQFFENKALSLLFRPGMKAESFNEWESVYASHMKAIPPTEPPKLGEFMLMIAALGGYQARKSQGPPGMIVMWKGLQKAYGLSEG
jgi:hypothetical protein